MSGTVDIFYLSLIVHMLEACTDFYVHFLVFWLRFASLLANLFVQIFDPLNDRINWIFQLHLHVQIAIRCCGAEIFLGENVKVANSPEECGLIWNFS